MVFASLEFLTLFLPAFLVGYVFTPQRLRNLALLLASWIFHAWWSPPFLLLFIGLSTLAWGGGLVISHTPVASRRRLYWLAGLIVANVAVLCWFKYANILFETFNAVLGWSGAMPMAWQRVVLPIGLSFTVLQAISYFVDVHRGTVPAEKSFVNYAMYLALFGHLVAGPIIRYDWIRKELEQRPFNWENFAAGARRFAVGMSMKVLIADTLAPVVDTVFAAANPSLVDAWIGCAGYTLQLFFDFAGYSAMAIGIGLMLGFHFPENFDHPYLARNIQDFWRRWHISLSHWLRDYLYFSLGGSRGGALRTYGSLLLTMAIGGLWHGGDSWNFLLWGTAQGVALCAVRYFGTVHGLKLPTALAHLCTMLFVMLAWTLFRAVDFHGAIAMYRGQFGLNSLGMSDNLALMLRLPVVLAFVAGVICVLLPALRLRERAQRWGVPGTEAVTHLWPAVGFMVAFALVAGRGFVPFLYFQF